jgi:hypothetical protein
VAQVVFCTTAENDNNGLVFKCILCKIILSYIKNFANCIISGHFAVEN